MRGWRRQHQTSGGGQLGGVHTLTLGGGGGWRHTGNDTEVEIHMDTHKSRETHEGMYRENRPIWISI